MGNRSTNGSLYITYITKMIRALFIILSCFILSFQTCFSQDLVLPHALEYYVGTSSAYFGKIEGIRSLSEISATVSFSIVKTMKGEEMKELYFEFPVPGIESREYKDPLWSLKEGEYYLLVDPIIENKQSNYRVAYRWKSLIPVNEKAFRVDSILLALFDGNKTNTYINTDQFKGHLLNNKPNGKWYESSDTGQYLLGTRVGKWVIKGDYLFFGIPFIDTNIVEVYNDTIVQHYKYSKRMEYKGELLRTWNYNMSTKNWIIKKYKSGKVYQTAVFDEFMQLKKIIYMDAKGRYAAIKASELNGVIEIVDYYYYLNVKLD